jgi:putative transposase
LLCSRYVELNPVHTGMVHDLSQYSWSSYHCNALGKPDALITPHPLYCSFGKGFLEQKSAYRMLFKASVEDKVLVGIRTATNEGRILGGDRFQRQIEETLKRQVMKMPHGDDRRSEAFRLRHD